jgi:glycosyltransferase involved in cell wall biosynthesis
LDSVPLTVMVFTLDEEVHLPSCLKSVSFADDVIVIDSGSSDATIDIARNAGARVFEHAFQGFGSQRNWALDKTSPKHEWILVLDADERVPDDLRKAMEEVVNAPADQIAAYRIARRFHMWGKWLRYSSLYPTYVVRLIRRGRVRYVDRGHAETQMVEGSVGTLNADLIDENIKGVQEWLERQNRYARREAVYELANDGAGLGLRGALDKDALVRREALKSIARRIPMRSLWYFLYGYFLRQGFRDGREGLMFCYMRALYQAMIEVHRFDLARTSKRG